jgi:hypothetical protein
MAQENFYNGTIRTFIASGAITQNYPVELNATANTVNVIGAAADVVVGIALDTVADGQNIDVLMAGPTKLMVSAAAISKGDYVGLSGTAGKIGSLTLDGSGTTLQYVLGIAMNAASGADEEVEVLWMPFVYQI